MEKRVQRNKGFTLIELLIAMAILSVIMIMVVGFMSTTTGAYRKTKKNINVQTEALQVFEQMSDTLMQAKYVRISSSDGIAYTIEMDSRDKSTNDSRVVSAGGSGYSFDFVPDNYANYSKHGVVDANEGRKIIMDTTTFELVSETNTPYPVEGDVDKAADGDNSVRSFRMLKMENHFTYIKPDYIYAEYSAPDDEDLGLGGESSGGGIVSDRGTTESTTVVPAKDSYALNAASAFMGLTNFVGPGEDAYDMWIDTPWGDWDDDPWDDDPWDDDTSEEDTSEDNNDGNVRSKATWCVIYYITGTDVYTYRYKKEQPTWGYSYAKEKVNALAAAGKEEGLLTNRIRLTEGNATSDFYVTADAEGDSIIMNVMFKNEGYLYNLVEPINLRNSNVLTVKAKDFNKK